MFLHFINSKQKYFLCFNPQPRMMTISFLTRYKMFDPMVNYQVIKLNFYFSETLLCISKFSLKFMFSYVAGNTDDNLETSTFSNNQNVSHSTGKNDDSSFRPEGVSEILFERSIEQVSSRKSNGFELNYEFNRENQEPIDSTNVKVLNNENKRSRLRHYCFLCKDVDASTLSHRRNQTNMFLNITRHWRDVHPDHVRVLEIENSRDEKSKRQLITRLKSDGDRHYNHSLIEQTGKLLYYYYYYYN